MMKKNYQNFVDLVECDIF